MTKKQKGRIDEPYDFFDKLQEQEENEQRDKKKSKEREKRIKQRNKEKEQFDLETETVIGMTNKNNQNRKNEEQQKITRKQEKILKKKKKIKRIIKCITLLLIIVGGIVFALVSPIFNVIEINVKNNVQIATDMIISLSDLQTGENIFRFSSSRVKREIKTNPYIESVQVKRKFPNKVEIIVEERQRDYNVEFLNGFAYINKQGYILEISEQKLDSLPVLLGISTNAEEIMAGSRLNKSDLSRLETVIQIMNICNNYELSEKVSSIDISDRNNFLVYMDIEKKVIYLGDESNISNKMLYIPIILKENQGKEGNIYIDKDKDTVNKYKARFREKV